ncbi:hypothetical protein WA026_023660 [Henosepilachna vigintioctopunctata]|uniref:Uncharacterized protein n=1 Tax=Henosepilachna vigintioctopunctata TaxID=420089 RepID=A0AAW1V2D8_9CUCU
MSDIFEHVQCPYAKTYGIIRFIVIHIINLNPKENIRLGDELLFSLFKKLIENKGAPRVWPRSIRRQDINLPPWRGTMKLCELTQPENIRDAVICHPRYRWISQRNRERLLWPQAVPSNPFRVFINPGQNVYCRYIKWGE